MISILALVSTAALAQSLPNQQNNIEGPATGIGAGAVVGTPTGLALAWRPDPSKAVQAAAGYGGKQGSFGLNVDYVQTVWALFSGDGDWIMPLYVGAGVRYRGQSDTVETEFDQNSVGVRLPVGIRVYPEDIRLDIFAEAGPAVHFLPAPTLAFDFGMGVRLWAGKTER